LPLNLQGDFPDFLAIQNTCRPRDLLLNLQGNCPYCFAVQKAREKHKDGDHKQWTPSRCQSGLQETPENTKIGATTAKNEAGNYRRFQNNTKRPPNGSKTDLKKA